MSKFAKIDIPEQISLKGGQGYKIWMEILALMRGFSTPDMASNYGDGNTTDSGAGGNTINLNINLGGFLVVAGGNNYMIKADTSSSNITSLVNDLINGGVSIDSINCETSMIYGINY